MRKKTTARTQRASASKKRRNKKPSAKQLAARRKFAAAARARSRAAQAKQNRPAAKKKAAKRRNKTIIVKPRKVTLIQVGKVVRRKVRNGYVDLVIRGTAEKTPEGWKVGKKTIPQGKGTVSVSSGYYLDKATGTIFARRARNTRKRNLDHRDSDHPIEVTKHWRQGPPGYLTPWQRAHHAGQRDLFAHGIKPAKKRNSTKKASPAVKQLREKFSGQKSTKVTQVFAPKGTPSNVAKLGRLALIETESARIKPTGTVYLCTDGRGKLHLCGATDAPLYSGPRQNFGQVLKVEYEAAKPHLYPGQGTILFYHRMGEEGGKRPTLHGDGKGGLKFRGGSYKIRREGIVD